MSAYIYVVSFRALFATVVSDIVSVRRPGKVEKHGGKVLILFFFRDFALGGKSMSSF